MILKKNFRIVRNLICAIGLIIISPFLFFAALMIIIEDGMPVFFIQERVGKNNVIFKIIKIRTLKREAPNTGTHQLDQKYQLVCGKLFRKIKLDEFPQLINVLKGDINLIGPRPGLISQAELTEFRSAKGIYEIKLLHICMYAYKHVMLFIPFLCVIYNYNDAFMLLNGDDELHVRFPSSRGYHQHGMVP